MYSDKNFKTKKAFKEQVEARNAALAAGDETLAARLEVRLFSPGLGTPKQNGTECVEGPHYPQPHSWYATATVADGVVVKVK